MKLICCGFVLCAVVCAMYAPATAQFKGPTLYTVGVEPQQVVAVDVNNDGHLDLVIPDFTSLQISVLLGNGDGTFQPPLTLQTLLDPSALVLGDFNGDGKLDIAVAEYDLNSSTLQIFLGNGDGTFTAGESYPIAETYDIAAADLEGHGRLDLVVAGPSNKIQIFRGNGDGTFRASHSYHVPEPERVLAVDLNRDGHPDLAVLAYCGTAQYYCRSGAVAVLINDGTGNFGAPAYFSVNGVGPDGVAAADLNHDGNIDLVVANNNFQQPSTISVLLGNGDGTFQPVVNYTVGSGPAGIAIADFNGDGNLDIAVANTGSNNVTLLYGRGNGKFESAGNLTYASGSLPLDVAAADFNGDGLPDLAVVLDYANQIAVDMNAK